MPVHLAIKSENIPLSVYLFRNHGRDWKTADGRFPLHIAAQYDKTNIADLLLEISSPEEVNAQDSKGNTPAHLASMYESDDTLKSIEAHTKYIKHVLNKEGKTTEEVNPKSIALVRFCKSGSALSVDSMLKSGAKVLFDSDGNSILYVAYTSNIERFEKYIMLVNHQPALVNHKNGIGETLLHKATMNGDKEFVEFMFVQGNVDINAIDGKTMTPTHCAIDRSNTDLVKLLLKHGADINIKNVLGRACSHTCVVRNQEDILKELLKVENIDVNSKDKFGRTPFQLAIEGGHRPAIWYLARHPAFNHENHEPEATQVHMIIK